MRSIAVALFLVLSATGTPAAAQSDSTYVWIRFNPSYGSWTGSTYAGIPMSWTHMMFGGTIAYFPWGNWGFRLNLDDALVTNIYTSGKSSYSYAPSSGRWLSYDASVAYRIPFGRAGGFVTLFGGWGGTWVTFEGALYGFSRQYVGGPIVGADARVPVSGPWYLTGSVTVGPNQTYSYEIGNPPYYYGTPGRGTFLSYSVAIGYTVSSVSSVEIGWRGGGFTGAGTGTPADGANLYWGGVYLGLAIRK